jgi:hypothetical protein
MAVLAMRASTALLGFDTALAYGASVRARQTLVLLNQRSSAQREKFLPFLNLSIFDIPYIGGEALDEVAVMDNSQDSPLEICQRFLKTSA